MERNLVIFIAVACALSIVVASFVAFGFNSKSLSLFGSADLTVDEGQPNIASPQYMVDATIYFVKHPKAGDIQLVGSWTKMGINCTFGKLTGLAASYNMSQYAYNITSMSIGNQGTLNTDTTVLPGEWNRTDVTPHDASYNSCNFTAVFYPDTGPYTADCFGLNIGPVTIGLDYTLIAYDTFTEVTGIDNTFTITGEFRIYSTSA